MATRRSSEDPRARIEAALYAAGRPLSDEELASAAGLTSRRRAATLAREIAKEASSVLRAIEIIELPGGKFTMQLNPELNMVARRFATKPLVPASAMKTLSYVAYFQPVSAHDISLRRGPQIYSHLHMLEKMGLITSQSSGRTRVYRSTKAFSEFFGLSEDLEQMKKQLQEWPTRKH